MSRFLDSINATAMNRAPYGVLRAASVKVTPSKIYFRFGSRTIVWYDKATFLSRIDLGGGIGAAFGGGRGTVLMPDGSFTIDGGGWKVPNFDVEEILTDFDVDDQGYIYVAGSISGWGIVKDGRLFFQNQAETAAHVIALKGTTNSYALQSSGAKASLYNVNDRAHPVKLGAIVPKVKDYETNADNSRVAIVNSNLPNFLEIYSADGLAASAHPLFIGGDGAAAVTGDGANFFALHGNVIRTIRSSGDAYENVLDSVTVALSQPTKIHYNDGYLVVSGGSPFTWQIFRVTGTSLTPVPFDATPTTSAEGMNALDGVVVNGRPILCGKSVGDVYPSLGVVPDPKPIPVPAEPGFDDQQSEKYIVRDTEASAKAHRDELIRRGVSRAGYFRQADGHWQVYWS